MATFKKRLLQFFNFVGVVLLRGFDGKMIESRSFHEATKVTFDNLADDVIKCYVATKEPLDKAGTTPTITSTKFLNFLPQFCLYVV